MICALPTVFSVTVRETIDIVSGVKFSNVNEPGLLEDGSCNSNDPKLHSFGDIVYSLITGFTVNTAVISPLVYPVVAACVAVIIAFPTLRIRTILPEMSATGVALPVLLIVNVNTAAEFVLLDVGSVNEKLTSRIITRGSIVKLDNVGGSAAMLILYISIIHIIKNIEEQPISP